MKTKDVIEEAKNEFLEKFTVDDYFTDMNGDEVGFYRVTASYIDIDSFLDSFSKRIIESVVENLKEDAECFGHECCHQTIDKHYVLFEEDINKLLTMTKEGGV